MDKDDLKKTTNGYKLSQRLWDLWCIGSVVGIWPRFIEPNLIKTNTLNLTIPSLPEELIGFKIVQFSDLHFHSKMPDFFLNKIIKKIRKINPDLIVFTGDFLCRSVLEDKERLKKILNSFSAPYGCYAILGNHDYEKSVTINELGEYDIVSHKSSDINRGFSRLFQSCPLKKTITPRAQSLNFHPELISLLKESPFTLLHNETHLLQIGGSYLNICGLGEYMLGKFQPDRAFENYDQRYPGIVLSHNPDTFPMLTNYPGEIILCGHTHGGQVNLPWIVDKLTLMENPRFKRGLFKEKNKWMHVTTGLGGILPFRWFAMPEIVSITIAREPS